MASYNVGIANPFDLLNDEEIINQKPESKNQKSAKAKSSNKAEPRAQKENTPSQPAQKRAVGGNNRNNNRAPAEPSSQDSKNPRESRRRERPQKTRGRQFDRRPGTGRSLVENKKGGAGKGNWGKPEDQTYPEEDRIRDEKEGEEEAVEGEDKKAEPEEPKAMSLAEYRQKLEEEKANIGLPEARKVEDDWTKEYKALPRKGEAEQPQKQLSKNKRKKKERQNHNNTANPVNEFFRDEPSKRGGRGGRGGRGRGRGGRGGFAGRGGRKQEFKLDVEDEASFPSLGVTATA